MSKVKLTNKEIPLKNLVISERNVRSISHTEEKLRGFASSIKASGLINPLTVMRGEGSTYEVVCGGGRLKAYQLLLQDGDIKDTEKVRCSVAPSDANIEELSLMENMFRKNMTAAEEFEAYNAMQNTGMTVEEIAKDFGHTVKHVKQRLKLARVAPEIFQAFKEGELSLDAIQAFALTDNHERQLSYFNVVDHYYSYSIRSAMAQETYSVKDRLVKFITLEAYKAANGEVVEDLFSTDDDLYLKDVALVERLAEEKLSSLKQQYIDEGWSWVEATMNFESSVLNTASTSIQPETVDLSAEDQKLKDELQTRMSEMDDLDCSDWEDNYDEEYEQIEQDLAELEEKEQFYSEEVKSKSGVYLTVDHYGEIETRFGLVKDKPEEGEDNEIITDNPDAIVDSSSDTDDEKDQAKYSGTVLDSLTAMRVKTYQAALSNEHELANNILLHSLAKCVFSYGPDSALDIHLDKRGEKLNEDEREATPAQKILDDIHEEFHEKISGKGVEMFERICLLSQEDKQRLQSYCISVSFKDQLASARPNTSNKFFNYCKTTKHVEDLMDINIRDYWKPTVDSLFSRLKAKELLRIGTEIVDEQWALSRSTEKKSALAKAVAHLFNPENEQLTAEQREKAAAWLPEVMGNAKLTENNDELPDFLEADEDLPIAAQ